MAHWSAYLNNLFFADGEYHNASNVEDFINEETVIYGPGRAAFADAVPSLLVSLGFLGTLIGLAQGLAGFNMADADAAQQSIMVLIPGMRYAFVTSIFGVVGSILFTLITRAVYGSTEHTLRSFYGAMSRYAGVLSVDPLTQVAIYQQEQTALIQTMAKDLNGAFTENITRAIRDAVEPMNQSLKNFMTVTSKDQLRFLDAVVMRFVDRMDEVVGGQLKNFGRMLDQTNRVQQDAFASIRAGMADSEAAVRDLRGVQHIAQDMAKSLGGYLDDLRAAQRESQDTVRSLAGAAEQMDLVARQQSNYLKTVSAMHAEVTRSVDAMTAAVDAYAKRFAEDNAAAAQAMQKAAGDLREAGARIEGVQHSAAQGARRRTQDHARSVSRIRQPVHAARGLSGDVHFRFAEQDAARRRRDVGAVPRPDGSPDAGAGSGAARAQRRRGPALRAPVSGKRGGSTTALATAPASGKRRMRRLRRTTRSGFYARL